MWCVGGESMRLSSLLEKWRWKMVEFSEDENMFALKSLIIMTCV